MAKAKSKRLKKGRATKIQIPSKTGSAKGAPWTFPKLPLERALEVAKAIEEKNAGKEMPSLDICRALGFNQPDWRYLDLLRSANLYGLVTGSGAASSVGLTAIGSDIVAPSSAKQRADALRKAFESVKEFKVVEAHYGGKRLPEDDFFLNTLTRQFEIPRDRVNAFADVFRANLKFLADFIPAGSPIEPGFDQKSPIVDRPPVASAGATRSREHLNTCFVMMPFGAWFDTYYEKIYVPAIKEAGLEPIRADELYSSGSVVDQIWEQIQRSKVLLADLTGRNANVFYELGLAHAAGKPVVFSASKIEDVPFDLRHLRVISYEVRDPDWSVRLRRSVTEHLRDAIRYPNKSIPAPFRSEFDLREKEQLSNEEDGLAA